MPAKTCSRCGCDVSAAEHLKNPRNGHFLCLPCHRALQANRRLRRRWPLLLGGIAIALLIAAGSWLVARLAVSLADEGGASPPPAQTPP